MSVRVFPAAGEADEVRSLDLYNAIHPREPASLSEAREWRRQQRHAEIVLAELDGELAGSAHIGIPTYSDLPTGKAYVLSTQRRQGVGRALHGALSSWALAHAAEAMQTFIDDDDPESLAWAERRGFREVSREALVELRLATYEPRPVEPPAGVEIVTWAGRPELARGLYEVAAEVGPDIPGDEDHRIEPFEEWLSVHMQGVADLPRARSLRWRTGRWSDTPSSASGTRSRTRSSTTSRASGGRGGAAASPERSSTRSSTGPRSRATRR